MQKSQNDNYQETQKIHPAMLRPRATTSSQQTENETALRQMEDESQDKRLTISLHHKEADNSDTDEDRSFMDVTYDKQLADPNG